MNAPDRFELFVLGPDEKKIDERPVASMANTSDFLVKKEDHTLGNLLSEHLKMHPQVLMAGYKVPHPNVPEMFLRVQTNGEITPKEAVVSVLKDLLKMFSNLSQEFIREFELRRVVEARRNDDANPGHG
ncbi:hypothetical protein ACRALDRAFT_1053599 [Sodiomyces alcalophilus JCM 7366]|uniref:uncharacterized protein n=1 Tax=Sodiomyces alcalophilus JCM 7366 TaxID=591952 RepID=UPI0039B53EFA